MNSQVSQDFDKMFPGAANNFLKNFPKFRHQILRYMRHPGTLTHETTKSLLKKYEKLNENHQNISLMFGLAASIFNHPSTSFQGEGKRMKYSYTIEDVQQSFLLLCPATSSIPEIFSARMNQFIKIGSTIQPFLYAVGSNIEDTTEYIVALDNIYYKFSSYQDALFCLIKVYFTFDFSYPKYCCNAFQLIQQLFFEINLDSDENLSEVSNALKQIKSEAI